MVENSNSEDCQKKAADLGFDLTKQFLTLAFAGIAFIVGLSVSSPGAVSVLMFWLVIGAFGASAVLGFLFLMHGVNLLSVQKTYDIYASSLRILAVFQIILMLVGTMLLVQTLATRQKRASAANAGSTVEIRTGPQQTVTYPVDLSKDFVIEVENGKVKISSVSKR